MRRAHRERPPGRFLPVGPFPRAPGRVRGLLFAALVLGALLAPAASVGRPDPANSGPVVPDPALVVSNFTVSPAEIVLGNASTLAVNASGGVGPLSYVFSGLPTGCASANLSALRCAPVVEGSFSIVVNVTDVAGDTASVGANLTVQPVTGSDGLEIDAFGASPNPVYQDAPTTLSVTVAGTSAALSYAYPELAPGCTAADTARLSCAVTGNGSYPLYVVATTAAGGRVGAFGNLTVLEASAPPPSITSFSAAPTPIVLGDASTLSVRLSGGVPPLTYNYSALPSGCAPEDAPSLVCVPDLTGTFVVRVNVTDADGRVATATANLAVTNASYSPTRSSGGSSGTGPWLGLDSVAGAATLAFDAAAALLLVGTERELRRRRLRSEGEEIVRGLLGGGSGAAAPSPSDGTGAAVARRDP